MKPLISFLLMAFVTISCHSQVKTNDNMIGLDKIEELFDNMKSNGVNTDREMLYGYFFTNKTREPLQKLADELKKQSYKFVDIYPDENNLLWLHIEKIEIHNPKSLFARNQQLYALADKYRLDSYDGFDIGNTDPINQ